MLWSAACSPAGGQYKRHGLTGASPAKNHKGGEGTGADSDSAEISVLRLFFDSEPFSLFVAGWCYQLHGDTPNININFSNSTWVKSDQQQAGQLISNTDRWDLMGARGTAIKRPHILALTSVFMHFPFYSVNTDAGAQQTAQIRTTDIYWTLLRLKLIVKLLGQSKSSPSFMKKNS